MNIRELEKSLSTIREENKDIDLFVRYLQTYEKLHNSKRYKVLAMKAFVNEGNTL